jgi:beta-1,4-N-acetylglucosaminyltransferase
VIVLGSGGHTAEMISLMRDIDLTFYKHRTYIISSEDDFSARKASALEERIQQKQVYEATRTTVAGENDPVTGLWDIKVVPRARKIHQSLYTTPFSSAWCFIGCLEALYKSARVSTISPGHYPDAIITNGPATAVIVILASLALKFLYLAPLWSMKVIYVESWARVKSLSLSGKILLKLRVCERFIVQWESLTWQINRDKKLKEVEYHGFMVE